MIATESLINVIMISKTIKIISQYYKKRKIKRDYVAAVIIMYRLKTSTVPFVEPRHVLCVTTVEPVSKTMSTFAILVAHPWPTMWFGMEEGEEVTPILPLQITIVSIITTVEPSAVLPIEDGVLEAFRTNHNMYHHNTGIPFLLARNILYHPFLGKQFYLHPMRKEEDTNQ